jgi:hypothetical protein
MATFATDQANSSKKSPAHDTRDRTKEDKAGKQDVADKPAPRSPPTPAPDPVDAVLENPYDNVACTD